MNVALSRRIFHVLLAVFVSGCAFPRGGIHFVEQTPVTLVSQHEQRIEFRVSKWQTYFFDLHFEFKDSVDRARVASLVGQLYVDRNGKVTRDRAIPTPVRLSIRRVEHAGIHEITSFEVDPKPTGFTHRTMGKNIGHAALQPGQYVAVFTPLRTANEFNGTQIEFVVFYDMGLVAPQQKM